MLPYRDLYCNQFPGALYLFWILGRVAGWGRSCVHLRVRRRRDDRPGPRPGRLEPAARRHGSCPDSSATSAFLSYYLTLDYSLAAQRDWHAPFFAVLGTPRSSRPGRDGSWRRRSPRRDGDGALLIRPHAVLFLPAVALQLARRDAGGVGRPAARPSGRLVPRDDHRSGSRPLSVSGILPDFLAGVAHNNSWSTQGRGLHAASHPRRPVQPARHVRHLVVPHRRRPARQVGPEPTAWRPPSGWRRSWWSCSTEPIHPAESTPTSRYPRGGLRGERRRADPAGCSPPRRVPAIFPAPLGPALARRQLAGRGRNSAPSDRASGGAASIAGRAADTARLLRAIVTGRSRHPRFYEWSDYRAMLGLPATPAHRRTPRSRMPSRAIPPWSAAGPPLRVPTEGISWLWMANR